MIYYQISQDMLNALVNAQSQSPISDSDIRSQPRLSLGLGAQRHIAVESKVEHELNKPKRDEPAACTVASIS
eukprot:scaffold7202_cov110-Isochrysis_galbana.AAC.5